MLNLLKGYPGALTINNTEYGSVTAAIQALKDYQGEMVIELNKGLKIEDKPVKETKIETNENTIYRIKVRQYMTKPASPEFDFQDKWNKGIPMPMRIMVGKKLEETKGMVKMELWGEIIGDVHIHCMKCGRTLTNPVSKLFGIGPECGGHAYTNPFDSEEELEAALDEVNEQLMQIKWTGWIIKSAIEEIEIIE